MDNVQGNWEKDVLECVIGDGIKYPSGEHGQFIYSVKKVGKFSGWRIY